MSRRRAGLLGLCVVVVAAACAGCTGREADTFETLELSVHRFGLRAEFAETVELQRAVIRDEDGSLVQEVPAAGRRRRFDLVVALEPGRTYGVQLQLPGTTVQRTVNVPPPELPLSAEVEAPLGQTRFKLAERERAAVVVPIGSTLAIGLVVESRRQAATRFELDVSAPEGILLDAQGSGLEGAGGRLAAEGTLDFEFDYRQYVFEARHTEEAAGDPIRVRLRQWPDAQGPPVVEVLELYLSAVEVDQLRRAVEPAAVVFPAGPLGRRRAEQLADTVVLPDPVWAAVRRWLRPSGTMFNFYEPYAWQSVHVVNRSDRAISALVEAEVIDLSTGEPLDDFAPPAWLAPSVSPTTRHLVSLAANETTAVELPLYVRESVRPGRYQRRFRIYPLGGTEPIAAFTAPLEVVRGDPVVSGVTLVSLPVAVLVWAGVLTFRRRLFGAAGTHALATIALLAGVHFVVSYTSRIGGSVLAALVGPFSIFVAGLGSEGLTSLLLAVAVTLVPRAGTFMLSTLAVFLLNAVFSGQIGLVDLLFVTVSFTTGEALLALLGLTTGGGLSTPRPRAPANVVLRMAAALGVANAATLFAQFCLIQVLHRLFFADWYIAAVSLVTGLLYGAVGAGAGTVLGYQLRRSAR